MYSLNVNKAVGHDNIPAYFLKNAATAIAPYLQYFIKFSFKNGVFPDSCTLAKIIPLYKKRNKTDPNNCRPISLLSCFSKILEHLIYNRLLKFLKKHNVIHKTQYGFQKKKNIYIYISTDHAILNLTTASFDNINQNLYTALIFLDLCKAFDMVSHDILLHNLDRYGIRGPALQLISHF